MKTVMKKLLSLALVAILLVSAVPFQASAIEPGIQSVKVPFAVTLDGEVIANKEMWVSNGPDIPLDEALAKKHVNDWNNRKFVKWSYVGGEGGVLNFEWLWEDDNATECGLTLELESICKHNYQENKTASTCKQAGSIVRTCTKCGDTKSETLPLAAHTWGDWSETVKPTATTAGEKVQTCSVCGETQKETIPATGATTYTVTFIAGDNKYTRTFEQYTNVSNLPGGPDKKGYKFQGWFSEEKGQGEQLSNGDKWSGEHYTYYAYYVESTDDNISTLSVYARFYIGGVQQGNTTFLYSQDFTDGQSMLTWLNNNETTTSNAIFKVVSAEDYEWSPRYYYNYSGNEPLTEQNLVADGDKSIVVKVYGKKATQANVLLYVHQYNSTSKKYETKSIHEMSGYTAGNTVTKSAADTIVKKNYTGTNMTITGLYSDTAWEQLLAGQNPTAANGIKVSDNGTMKIHVILKNGTASTSTSKADTTNPKTGDMIMVPVVVMLASAAAAAFVYMNSKKRAR